MTLQFIILNTYCLSLRNRPKHPVFCQFLGVTCHSTRFKIKWAPQTILWKTFTLFYFMPLKSEEKWYFYESISFHSNIFFSQKSSWIKFREWIVVCCLKYIFCSVKYNQKLLNKKQIANSENKTMHTTWWIQLCHHGLVFWVHLSYFIA